MLRNINISLFCLLTSVIIGTAAHGQNNKVKNPRTDKEQQAVVRVNKLDVVYPDDEYSGIVIDRKEHDTYDDTVTAATPFLMAPPPMADTIPSRPNLYQSSDDEGAESEDEILYASFDPNVIHYPKADLSKWKDTVVIHLINPRRGQNFSYPTPEISRASSHFGARRRRFHYGVDLAMPTGQPVFAAFDGVVRVSVFNKSYGNLIVIRHTNGLETYYAHMSKRIAQSGDTVRAGDTIGLCGNTGRSYGSHVHFEIRYMGLAMNPEDVVDCSTRTLKQETLYLTPQSFAKRGYSSSYSSKKRSTTTQTRSGVVYYTVKQGDTLGKIAKRYGTTVRRLCQLNGIKETTVLKIGRRLRVK